jgi:uncharacterized protein
MPPLSPDRRAGWQALSVFLGMWVAVAVLVRLRVAVPLVGDLGSALVAMAFLYVPSWVARWRGEDLLDYGFSTAPLGRGLRTAAVAMLCVFPVFVVAYLGFYEGACHSRLAVLVPPGMCARYHGLAAIHAPALTLKLLEFCAVQLVVVALPEELFFRGMMLRLLERRFPTRRTLAGVPFGLAAVLATLAFALIHLPREGDPRALATFFPGLLFVWMRLRTGSLLASTVTHAGSNILIRVLELSLLG